jgi:hypothetical protein
MTDAYEVHTVRTALHQLGTLGYKVVASSDGVTRYIRNDVEAHLKAADGTDQAAFFLEKPGHHCSLFVVWGLGGDCIADISADSDAELDRIDEVIYV